MKDVFEIDEASHISANQWQIKGKALQTIEAGETVYGAVGRTYEFIVEPERVLSILHEPEGGSTLYPFIIVAIFTYGREIDQLGGGMTGIVNLEGEHGETLKDTRYLVTL
jgi:hypothetical protein